MKGTPQGNWQVSKVRGRKLKLSDNKIIAELLHKIVAKLLQSLI